MRRREFITLVGGGTATLLYRSPGARAQQSPMQMVAFIHGGAAEAMAGRIALFRKGLNETGFNEG